MKDDYPYTSWRVYEVREERELLRKIAACEELDIDYRIARFVEDGDGKAGWDFEVPAFDLQPFNPSKEKGPGA